MPGTVARDFNSTPTPGRESSRARQARYSWCGQVVVTGEVERVLGRPACTYAEWVADHAVAFQNEQAR